MSTPTDIVERTRDVFFSDMAARVKHNTATEFGGAFVIVAPDGTVMESLVLDSKPDTAHFFMLLSTKIQQALEEIKAREARSHFGGR